MDAKELDPELDGIRHVNIYSQSRSQLGRWLSNFSRAPFVLPEYGMFDSMEGFYFYAATGFCNEALRTESGFNAKKAGVKFERVHLDNFMEIIESGIRAKIRCNGNIMEALRESTLPLAHYYKFGLGRTHQSALPAACGPARSIRGQRTGPGPEGPGRSPGH